jgi:hypothetical protein
LASSSEPATALFGGGVLGLEEPKPFRFAFYDFGVDAADDDRAIKHAVIIRVGMSRQFPNRERDSAIALAIFSCSSLRVAISLSSFAI